MTKEELIERLNADLRNEWKHMRFYLHHASIVTGLHAMEYQEMLRKHAASEMEHIAQFSDMIFGLGGRPTHESADFPPLHDINEILEFALRMEQEVVANYTKRIMEAEALGGPDGKYVELFLERQLEDSRGDVDRLLRYLSE